MALAITLQGMVNEQTIWIQKEKEKAQRIEYIKYCYLYTILTEKERARRMLEMLLSDIAYIVKKRGEVMTTVADCLIKALLAKYHLIHTQGNDPLKLMNS